MKEVKAYQSKDGLLFLTEEDCLDHEYLVDIKETERGTLISDFNKNITLTPAETKVFDNLFKFENLQDIAHELNLSLSTIKAHCKKIYRKNGVKNKMELLKKIGNFN